MGMGGVRTVRFWWVVDLAMVLHVNWLSVLLVAVRF